MAEYKLDDILQVANGALEELRAYEGREEILIDVE